MFVDASAIVAILTREPDAQTLADRLQHAVDPITSPVAFFEAVLAIKRKRLRPVDDVRREVDNFLVGAGIGIVLITRDDADAALVAHDRYGKGSGHPARLTMGDCFAYAAAKNRGVPLLYKGEDFAHTDLGNA